MTVGELRATLAQMDQDLPVNVSVDVSDPRDDWGTTAGNRVYATVREWQSDKGPHHPASELVLLCDVESINCAPAALDVHCDE